MNTKIVIVAAACIGGSLWAGSPAAHADSPTTTCTAQFDAAAAGDPLVTPELRQAGIANCVQKIEAAERDWKRCASSFSGDDKAKYCGTEPDPGW